MRILWKPETLRLHQCIEKEYSSRKYLSSCMKPSPFYTHRVTDSQTITCTCFYKAVCLYELLFVVVHVYYVNHNLTQAESIKQSAGKTRCSDSAQQLLPLQHNSFRKRVHVLKSWIALTIHQYVDMLYTPTIPHAVMVQYYKHTNKNTKPPWESFTIHHKVLDNCY